MALIYSTNQQPTTSAQVWYGIISLLTSAGWTVAAAGDGLSAYSPSSGTAVTSSGSGANGFNNNNAWIFIKMPGSNRGFVFQMNSSTNITVRYFGPSSLVTNTPSATTSPTSTTSNAASQDIVSNVAYFSTLTRTAYWADNTAPYGFGAHGWNTAGTPMFHFVLEAMQASSYHPLNQDPYVMITFPNGNNPNFLLGRYWNTPYAVNSRLNSTIKCWTKHNMIGSSFNGSAVCMVFPAVADTGAPERSALTTIYQNTSVYDGKDEEIPIQYMTIGSNSWSADFGIGTTVGWNSNVYVGFGTYVKNFMQWRTNMTTLSVNGTRDRISFGHCTLPWDGSIPLFP